MKPGAETLSVQEIRRDLAERAAKQEMPAYVYMYPPKSAYVPFSDGSIAAQTWDGVKGAVSLYVHFPFCEMKCSFCSLFATTRHDEDTLAYYVDTLVRELDLACDCLESRTLDVRSIYFGGGTPTILPTPLIGRLLDHVRRRLRVAPDAEVSIEAAPNSIDENTCSDLRRAGFNRISIGIQSFADAELLAMGRSYDRAIAIRAVLAAQQAGFSNVNIDLIYGLADQTAEAWCRNLEQAIALKAPTMTLYPLVVRARTSYGRQYSVSGGRFVSSSEKLRWYDGALGLLDSAEYTQQTFVTFTRPGGGCEYEANEFLGLPTIGLGAGARSRAPTLHYTSGVYIRPPSTATVLQNYFESVRTRRELPVRSAAALNEEEIIREYAILRLLYIGIDTADYIERFGEPMDRRFGPELEALRQEGLLETRGDRVQLTRRGRRFSSLVGELLSSSAVKGLSNAYL